MKANKLIEALQAAPQDADVLMYPAMLKEMDDPLTNVLLVDMGQRQTPPYDIDERFGEKSWLEKEQYRGKKTVVLSDFLPPEYEQRAGVTVLGTKGKSQEE